MYLHRAHWFVGYGRAVLRGEGRILVLSGKHSLVNCFGFGEEWLSAGHYVNVVMVRGEFSL
jgi:hypothetical protein